MLGSLTDAGAEVDLYIRLDSLDLLSGSDLMSLVPSERFPYLSIFNW